ncbi:MAG: restriction endonuclease subunit S [Sulfurimonas sp.]|nr:restriction endonuclease subunit S [Sulfurimonas sp.]
MSSWREVVLQDVVEKFIDYRGKTPEKTTSGIPLVTAKIVKNGAILQPNEFVSEETYKEFMTRGFPKINDVVLTTEAPLGEVALLKDDSVALAQRIILMRGKKDVLDNAYLKYFLQSEEGQYRLDSRASGTTVFGIKASVLKEMPILIPPLEEQKAIAEVLSSLDDKIDLLHRQNQTLESLAGTLFRQWFIEEAKEEWEEKPLGEIAIVQNGYAFSSKDYVEFESGHLEVFKMGHIEPGGGLRFSPKADFVPREKKLEKWTLNEDDIVMAMTDMKDSMGILGHPAMIDKSDKYVLNQRVARIYLENQDNLFNNYLLYLQLSSQEAIESLQSLANGGVQVNLSTEAIKSVSIIIPSKKFQMEKVDIFDEYLQKMKSNRKQIQTLENLRDTLLPKLLGGEVRVGI